ncbi:MAG TPA: hypothetical protein VFT96_10665 [Gemmatimonadaceae bacterium]|nr:hypothetical protein [Gemmatimonadaceae bacterium]
MPQECHDEARQYEEQRRQDVERKREDCAETPWWNPIRWLCTVSTWIESVWVTVIVTVWETVCVTVDAAETAAAALQTLADDLGRNGGFVGIVVGAVLGAIAGAVAGAIAGAIVGFLAGGLVGAVLGAFFGALIGGIMGAINGAIIGGLVGLVLDAFYPEIVGWLGDSFGPGPISGTATLGEVPSTPVRVARAHSFVLATDLRRPRDLRDPYDEEGVRVRYLIDDDGVAHMAREGQPMVPVVPDPIDLPPYAQPTGYPLSVSYDARRLGTWGPPPKFDMIAASGDRAIAKREESEDIFILLTGMPFVHPVNGTPVLLPQSYFKLDPEAGQAGARLLDLLAPLVVPGDDEVHPATERFPLFRRAYRLGAARLGLLQADVLLPPRVWQLIDARPNRDTADPPKTRFPTYTHVTYASNAVPFSGRARKSVRYTAVLGLGVGLSHLHEQYDARFGGEIDALTSSSLALTSTAWLTGLADYEDAFQLANGPVADYGGWVDGTCIYYQLVQLLTREELEQRTRDGASLADAFAILWSDEQFAFTERWRVLHPDDHDFKVKFGPGVMAVADRPGDYYPELPFQRDRFWCPMQAGHLMPWSRMGVARQIVVVSGHDPAATGGARRELYSIHWSWPTLDRSWRWRPFPQGAVVRLSTDSEHDGPELVAYADDVVAREDSSIVLRGDYRDGAERVRGRWFQRYLPADGQEQPSAGELAASAGGKPARGYDHPWSFVRADVYEHMDRFSHLGVYEPVRSRVQFYEVLLEPHESLTDEMIAAAVWEDRGKVLEIKHRRVDWKATADLLGPNLGAAPLAIVEPKHPSIYNDPHVFHVVFRPGLGWILHHADKRDDKLISFTNPPGAKVTLTDRDDSRNEITVTVSGWRRDPRDRHGRDVREELDTVSPPQVRRVEVTLRRSRGGEAFAIDVDVELARAPEAANPYIDRDDSDPLAGYARWVAMNIWQVKIAALDPATGDVLWIASLDRAEHFKTGSVPTTLVARGAPLRNSILSNDRLEVLLSPTGQRNFGTSVWFVGATGLAACADETVLAVAPR